MMNPMITIIMRYSNDKLGYTRKEMSNYNRLEDKLKYVEKKGWDTLTDFICKKGFKYYGKNNKDKWHNLQYLYNKNTFLLIKEYMQINNGRVYELHDNGDEVRQELEENDFHYGYTDEDYEDYMIECGY